MTSSVASHAQQHGAMEESSGDEAQLPSYSRHFPARSPLIFFFRRATLCQVNYITSWIVASSAFRRRDDAEQKLLLITTTKTTTTAKSTTLFLLFLFLFEVVISCTCSTISSSSSSSSSGCCGVSKMYKKIYIQSRSSCK